MAIVRRAYDDKPHWARDGRTVYFVPDRYGTLNVWARRVDPQTGDPIGEPLPVTTFNSQQQTLSPNSTRTQIPVTSTRLFVPITENSGETWTLDGVEK